ncbi:TIR domain-containing protein [Acinetobacter calcoaceticus]|uniref:TIR domain-containing protein n=1 Tax=Acinetobacter calcoaceticus TaxID=471 RepID=UPI003AF8A2E8
MSLPRTFVGFSSTDIHYYRMMQAWKSHKKFEFNFTDCQLHTAINSTNEAYIKRLCRERINMAGTFVSLIGEDTRFKDTFVKWEIEIALEKGCRIIAVNLDRSVHDGRRMNPELTPPILKNIGAIFIPFSSNIMTYALENYKGHETGNYYYKSSVYKDLAYKEIEGLE